MKQRNDPELLKLLNQRWRDIISKVPDGAYKRPVYNADALLRNRQAAQAMGRLDNSDPFASQRMALYLEQGYELASDVLHDCHAKQAARGKEPQTAVSEALAPVKRKIDEDRAWNQHRSKRFTEEKAA